MVFGKDGKDGKDIVRGWMSQKASKSDFSMVWCKDGKDGKDGKDSFELFRYLTKCKNIQTDQWEKVFAKDSKGGNDFDLHQFLIFTMLLQVPLVMAAFDEDPLASLPGDVQGPGSEDVPPPPNLHLTDAGIRALLNRKPRRPQPLLERFCLACKRSTFSKCRFLKSDFVESGSQPQASSQQTALQHHCITAFAATLLSKVGSRLLQAHCQDESKWNPGWAALRPPSFMSMLFFFVWFLHRCLVVSCISLQALSVMTATPFANVATHIWRKLKLSDSQMHCTHQAFNLQLFN